MDTLGDFLEVLVSDYMSLGPLWILVLAQINVKITKEMNLWLDFKRYI